MSEPRPSNSAIPEPPAPHKLVSLLGFRLASVDRHTLLDHMFSGLQSRRGGWLVTANLDFLRRYVVDPKMRELYDEADVRVADGMPLVWASRLQGDPLPERVPGSSLVWLLVERAATEGRSVYLLGGAADANERATRVLADIHPTLKICGNSSPQLSSPPTLEEIHTIKTAMVAAQPDIALIALGSPKQEQLIQELRRDLPATWFVGIGISLSFVAGDIKRAPTWMRRIGMEWSHRMIQEPRRLMKRYLVHDLPFAFQLFARAALVRLKGRS